MYALENVTLKALQNIYTHLSTQNPNAGLITLPKHLSGFHKLYTRVHATLKPAISTFYPLCKHTEVAHYARHPLRHVIHTHK